jgi:hypothetical protein
MVRPRYSEVDNNAIDLLNKAQKLLERTESIVKEDKCPSCGMKKSECLNKMGCGVKKYGSIKKERTHKLGSFTPGAGGVNEGTCADDCWCKIEKANPNFITTFSTEPQDVTFVAESGGQTRNAYYTSNQHLLDSEDVANKGATSYAYNLDTLSPTVNTHDRPFESHEITSGGESKTNE